MVVRNASRLRPRGNIYVCVSSAVEIFTAPLSSASLPTVTFSPPASLLPISLAFDGAGKLLDSATNGATASAIDVYASPFTNASTPSVVMPISASSSSIVAGP
jgi:hypothetical protein